MLENEILATYDSSTEIETGKGTVGNALGMTGTNGVYCGLFGSGADIIIRDWNYTNKLDMSKEYTVSGSVSVGLAGVNVADVTLTFVNKADVAKTYTVKPDADGKYSVQLPTSDYKVTVSHTNYVDNVFECRVMMDDVTNDLLLRKNKIEGAAFNLTEEGYYKSKAGDPHNRFLNGYGNAWEAELEIPNLDANKGIGFVLHKGTSNSIAWGDWIRIYLKKTTAGNMELVSNIKNSSYKAITLSEQDVTGKTFKVSLLNNRIVVMLEDKVLATYDSSSRVYCNTSCKIHCRR